MTVHEFLPIFFKLFNCGIFFAALGWAGKRYGVPVLRERTAQEQDEETRLNEEVVLQASRAERGVEDIAHNKERSSGVLQKMNVWLQAVEQKRAVVDSRYQELQAQMQTVQEKRAHARTWKLQAQRLLPRILADMQAELTKAAADPACQKRYLEGIIGCMKRDRS